MDANKKSVQQKKSLDYLLSARKIRASREVTKRLQKKAAELEIFKKSAEDWMCHQRSRTK